MPAAEPVAELDSRFSSEGAAPRPWSDVVGVLERAEIFWLSTVRRDGRPHVTPLSAMWLDGALHFCTGPGEQKAKNIEADPRCILTTGSDRFLSGLDVVVEGRAVRVGDTARLERLAAMWASKLDWPFDVVDGGFRERASDIAGEDVGSRGIAHVLAVAPTKVIAFGKGEPFSQTRYRFTTASAPAPRSAPSGPVVVSLPIEDRRRSFEFYRAAFDLDPVGDLADDGLPEPLQFALARGLRIMLVPSGGFGWVIGDRRVAPADHSECVLSITAGTEAEVVEVIGRAVAAGASVVSEPARQPWGFTGAVADPDGHVWMVRAADDAPERQVDDR